MEIKCINNKINLQTIKYENNKIIIINYNINIYINQIKNIFEYPNNSYN
jgi:hypothetical protein